MRPQSPHLENPIPTHGTHLHHTELEKAPPEDRCLHPEPPPRHMALTWILCWYCICREPWAEVETSSPTPPSTRWEMKLFKDLREDRTVVFSPRSSMATSLVEEEKGGVTLSLSVQLQLCQRPRATPHPSALSEPLKQSSVREHILQG